jgi:hypothetical protein
MTKAVVEAIANDAGGFEHIVGMRMANGTKFYFGRYALKAEDFITMGGMEILKLYHKDTMGGEAVSYLDVSEIVQLYTVKDIGKPIILRDILD